MREHIKLNGISANAILLMVIKLITTLIGFVTTRLLSQYLSVYDYGTYSQIILLISTIATITILGMVDGVNYFYCSTHDMQERESYISTIYILQCIVSLLAGMVILLLSGPLCAYFDNPKIKDLLIFAAVLPMLQNFLSMAHVLVVSVGKAKVLAIRNLLFSILRLSASVYVITVAENVIFLLLMNVIFDIAEIIWFGSLLSKNGCSVRLKAVKLSLSKKILGYCAPMAVFTLISALNRDLDKYLIAWLTDTQTLAVYTNASKNLPFDIVMTSFCTVLVAPITFRISHRNFTDAVQLYRLFLEIAYMSTGILCCAALAAAPQLMELLYSKKYLSGLAVFCVYILVDMVRFTNITLILSAAGKTKALMFLGAGTLALNAVMNIVLYRLLGVIGPAIATLLVTAVMGLVLLKLGARELHTSLTGLFDGKYLLKFVIESAVAVFQFSLLGKWLQYHIGSYFVILMIVAGGYGVCMLLLNGKRLVGALKQVNNAAKQV